jgi:glycosyltransferase involved in cell wall biosynthesis
VPRFSVIVPAYNASETLRTCVGSALDQESGEFEVIVSDDGSTDDTLAIANSLAEEDSRIRVVTGVNGGCSVARNRGFEVARGEFGVLLDADDQLCPEYLARMSSFIDANPGLDIYSCNGTRRFADGSGEPYLRGSAYAAETSWVLDDLIGEDRIFVMAAIRRELWERVGGFRTDLRYAEDYEFWLRALAAGATHRFLPERLGIAVYSAKGKSKNLVAHAQAQVRIFEDLAVNPSLTDRQHVLCADKLVALHARIARVQLEERLVRGDYTDARVVYRTLRPAYLSGRLYGVGLVAMTVSPALYAKLFAARKSGRAGR